MTSRARIPLALGVLAAVAAAPAFAAKGDLDLASRQSATDGGAGANSWSYASSISASGRFVAFFSEALNLDVEDGDRTSYVYDFKNRVVETVSRASDFGPPSDGDDVNPQISDNGRFVAFETTATNLGGPIDAGASRNIYVYDRKLDKVELVSRQSASNDAGGANSESNNPTISGNGRYVAFNTRATNLGGPIADGGEDNVYVYDRKADKAILASRRSGNGKGGNESSFDPSLASRAPVVVFATSARNLGGPINNDPFQSNLYAYNWQTRKTTLVSRRSNGGKGANKSADTPDVSADGRVVAFATAAKNLGGPIKGVPDDEYLVYVHDLRSKQTTLVSRRSRNGKPANASVSNPEISNNGRYVVFSTSATNLGGPTMSTGNGYVYDRKAKRTILVTRGTDGGPGPDDYAAGLAIAGAAPFVTFYTAADNIDPPGQPAYHGNFPPATSVYRFQFGK